MIPLSRRTSTRKLETALLSYSRQSLPRPARYSTPSKRNNAQAMLERDAPSQAHSRETPTNPFIYNGLDGMGAFLQRRIPYTFLPTPTPADVLSPLNDMVFPSSQVQDSLSVIDTCLHDCYDVPRAQFVLDQLRGRPGAETILEPRIFNLFFEAYLKLAEENINGNWADPLQKSWSLYQDMESTKESIAPIASTYAIMLKTWLKGQNYNSNSEAVGGDIPFIGEKSPSDLLRCMLNRKIDLLTVVGDRSLTSEEADKIIELLWGAASEMGQIDVLKELTNVRTMGADPLADVPEVMPVQITKKSDSSEEACENADADADADRTPFNIANLRKHLAEVAYAQRILSDDVASRQKLLEASVYDLAVHRLRREAEVLEEAGVGNDGKLKSAQLQKWMFQWHKALQEKIAAEVAYVVESETSIKSTKMDGSSSRMRMGPFLSLLKPEKLSLITILELMRLQGTGGVSEGMKMARALLTVGKAVEMEYKAEVLKKNNIPVPTVPNRVNDVGYFTLKAYEDLKEWCKSVSNYIEESQDWTSEWTQAIRARVGSFLVDILMEVAMVERKAFDRDRNEVSEMHPAFYHSYEYVRGHRLGVIRLNSIVAERLSKDDIRATLHPRHLPMLISPKPWTSTDEGGYLYNKSNLMRLKDTQEQLNYLRDAVKFGHINYVLEGLNILGSTPWKVNRDVFDIVLKVWNSGEGFEKIPEANYSEPEPVKPEDYDTNVEAKSQYMQAYRQWQLGKSNNHSSRCSVNYKVEIARTFLNDTMYFPHNIDFRGRAYPIPPHLNHIGDDLSRGLLQFAVEKPLGETGLRWLKIHLANLYGFDKGSFEERVQFTQDHMEDVIDSAERPLEGKGWWAKADDPWQCLAACKELTKAIKSGDPEGYKSALPVHQDGTCNGLQHYAALGGDMQGARQVNLDVTDRPADVYTHVAEMVEKQIANDVLKENKYALMLQGKIARKVVKQTVMTTVYGVTYIGARAQIEKQLKDRGDVPIHEAFEASAYLAKKVMACIGDLFTGAKEIQTWLTTSARLIAKSIPRSRIEEAIREGQGFSGGENGDKKVLPLARLPKEQMTSVIWTTPLGLPVVQPYRKTKRKQIMTSIQTVFISDPNSPSEVNSAKQATAFPPNFVHSLDATHMMLTAINCAQQGLTFASVHDSYWTHAADVEKMNSTIRETFIALHESNVLKKLDEEFRLRYADFQIPILSLKGSKLREALNKIPETLIASGEKANKRLSELDGEDILLTGVEVDPKSLDALASEPSVTLVNSEGEDLDLDAEAEAEAEDDEEKPKKRFRKKKSVIGTEAEVMSRFVNLVDLLPPLPERGSFDVKRVIKSKYFFS